MSKMKLRAGKSRPKTSAPAKKSRAGKKYVPTNVKIPALFNVISIRQEQPMLATRIYGQIAGFIHEPNQDRYDHLCEVLTVISQAYTIKYEARTLYKRRDPESVCIVSAMMTLMDIRDRAQRTGIFAVTATEAKSLDAAAGGLDQALDGIPVILWNEAQALVTRRSTEVAILVNQAIARGETALTLEIDAKTELDDTDRAMISRFQAVA